MKEDTTGKASWSGHEKQGKGKDIPVTVREGPYGCGCEVSSVPQFVYTFGSQMAVWMSLMRRPHLYPPPPPPKDYSWYTFPSVAESTPGQLCKLEGLAQLKNLIISSEVKPTTFRLVA
jgi:hypothetical protein